MGGQRKSMKRLAAGWPIRGLALALFLMGPSVAVAAANAVTPSNYIVPVAAGSTAAAQAGPDVSALRVPVAAGSSDDPALRPPMPNGLAFTDGSNALLPLTHFRGQVLLINFWATWCVPCVKEMKFLDRLQGDLKGQPLRVLAVSEDKGAIIMAKAFMERQKLTFLRPFGDPGGAAAESLHVEGIPTSFIVDKQGRLVQRVEGPYEWDDPPILNRFRGLLIEAP
jgi:thiol-disulfide isomerase/thioredoxin